MHIFNQTLARRAEGVCEGALRPSFTTPTHPTPFVRICKFILHIKNRTDSPDNEIVCYQQVHGRTRLPRYVLLCLLFSFGPPFISLYPISRAQIGL